MKIYKDKIAIPPGETIKNELKCLEWSTSEFAEKMGIPILKAEELLLGGVGISYGTAVKLEEVLEIPAYMWINLEKQYRQELVEIWALEFEEYRKK